MKALKILLILGVIYVGLVVLFESLLGYYQPANETTLVITTEDADGVKNPRVLAQLEHEGQLYVAANHWPRAWFNNARSNPRVEVKLAGGEQGVYTAVEVDAAEHQRVDTANALPLFFRILTGFPPRYFLRLEPQAQ
ncbi:MAG: nitroreductase/quinone reductase family protein [Pseudomonadota bacterium]